MNLLFTGASGFLGNNIFPLLKRYYNISTVGLTPDDTYMFNLVEEGLILNEQYDIVLHAAGKAHSVPQTDEEKNAFFDVRNQEPLFCIGKGRSSAGINFYQYSSCIWL